MKPGSPALQADSLPTELSGKPSGSLHRKITRRRKWQPTPVFLPEKSRDRGAIAQRVATSGPGLSNRARMRELQETMQHEEDKGCSWIFKGPEGILSRMLGYSFIHPSFFHSSSIYGAPTLSQNLPRLNPKPFQFP